MNEDKIVDRVRKLLELASSDNVNEAGNAAHRAQVLMSQHNITEAMVSVEADADEDEPLEVDTLHIHGSTQLPTWKGRLGVVMCEVNQCHCFRTDNVLQIIGRPSDTTTVRYLLSYVIREIDRLTEEESKLLGSPGRTWRNNFRLGAVDAVNRRLKEAYRETRAAMKQEADRGDTLGTGTALVLVSSAIAKLDERHKSAVQYGKKRLNLRAGGSSRSNFDGNARQAGRRAGESIDLSGDKRGLGSGKRKALGS